MKHLPLLQDSVFKFEDTAIVLLQTDYLNYQFIHALNQAYRLQMVRVDDIELSGGLYPCFLYFSEVARLTYVAIDARNVDTEQGNPAKLPVEPYNMILLVRGRDSWDFQEAFYKNFTEDIAEPHPTDIRQHLDWELLCQLKSNIFSVDTFCFSPRRGQSSTLVFSTTPSVLRARQTFLRRLQKFIGETFEALEWHLCEENNM